VLFESEWPGSNLRIVKVFSGFDKAQQLMEEMIKRDWRCCWEHKAGEYTQYVNRPDQFLHRYSSFEAFRKQKLYDFDIEEYEVVD
jgi:hypothetical protein